MLKIIVSQWDKNKDELRSILSKRKDLNDLEYIDLVKLTFEVILNNSLNEYKNDLLDLDRIHKIDDGDYQGTLLFLIPFKAYQPCEYEYLMTYVGYGSCSGCDALQAIQGYYEESPSVQMVDDFMNLCKDILTNTIKPYNGGWRHTDAFEHIEEEK
jgi:hypothetical protein